MYPRSVETLRQHLSQKNLEIENGKVLLPTDIHNYILLGNRSQKGKEYSFIIFD